MAVITGLREWHLELSEQAGSGRGRDLALVSCRVDWARMQPKIGPCDAVPCASCSLAGTVRRIPHAHTFQTRAPLWPLGLPWNPASQEPA